MAVQFRRLRREDGQGLIELIVALTILAVGIGAVLTVLTGSALSLQRSDQKGTALTLAETQIELDRNLAYDDIRLADSAWSAAPLTNAADPYFTAHSSDSTIPSGAKSGEITDTTTGSACALPLADHPECEPVRTVSGAASPDHRSYRIDTYITNITPKDAVGADVADPLRQVTVVVRNAQIASLPILARNTSTFSNVNAASFGSKQFPNLNFNVPRAWVTGSSGTNIPVASIGVDVSNGLYPLASGSPHGTLSVYAYAGAYPPSPPCGVVPPWTLVGTMSVDSGNTTYNPIGVGLDVAPGTYWWYVDFTGDASNAALHSRCSPAMTTTVVQASKWTPTISVSAAASATTGVQVDGSKFSATLASSSPGSSGWIHIYYVKSTTAPSSCTGGTELGKVSASGNGSYSQANPFPAAADGKYWWWATYDGDANNNAATSVCGSTMPSTTVGAGPSLASMTMKDTNGNGKVDQVVATFDKTLGSCAAPCKSGWALSNIPSGGSLTSVTTSGSTATLNIGEGSGPADTSVGTFTVALDTSSGIVDTLGRHGSFAATPPSDGAGPVPISMSSTNKAGGTAGKAEAGDQIAVTFSEQIATIGGASASTVTLSTASGNGKPVIVTMTNLGNGSGFAIGNKDNYLSGSGNNSAVFGAAGSTLGFAGSVVTVTLGTLSGSASLSTGSYVSGKTTAFTPAAAIKDAAGNSAAGTLTPTITFF
jgi:type II secretory pathway pseudopilin PulG